MAVVGYESSRKLFQLQIEKSVEEERESNLKDVYSSLFGSDFDKKSALDQAFRDKLCQLTLLDVVTEEYTRLLSLTAYAVQEDICTTATLFVMLSDLFDTITLDRCDEVFHFVEQHVNTWKLDVFYNAGKNYLLRMCNDLLRRLSKSQNTVFCGRIQLFLARLFPLEEKSGLNLMSQFNIDNVTVYSTKPEDGQRPAKSVAHVDPAMEVEEGEMQESMNIPIDYNLYKKFWSLQDYFRRPPQCYDKAAWKTFTNYSDEVLSCFSSYKLDDVQSARRRPDHLKDASASAAAAYFAKYLTSEKLLDLQLSDSNFRRYVLVQFLILFQYLSAQVKFKVPNQTLTDEQTAWIKDTNDRIFQVLRETPPDGVKFAQTIEHILSREENWNSWKNDGCPSFIRKKEDLKMKSSAAVINSRKRSIGDDLKLSVNGTGVGAKIVKMGNAELTRLWNLCPDDMEACRSSKRNYLPSLEDYFEEAVEQADSAGGIEETYKLVNNSTFAWKSLRLLARRSPHFFAPAQSVPTPPGAGANAQSAKPLSQYLSTMIAKLAKETTTATVSPEYSDSKEDITNGTTDEHVVTDEKLGNINNGTTIVSRGIRSGDEQEQDQKEEVNSDEESTSPSSVIGLATDGQLERLARLMTVENFKGFALLVNFEPADVAEWETESGGDVRLSALKMLKTWKEINAEGATVVELQQSLQEIGLNNLALQALGSGRSAT